MKWVVAIATAVTFGVCAAPASALGLDELLARHVEARGGAASLHAIRSLRATGTIRFGNSGYSVEGTFAEAQKGRAGVRMETTIQGTTEVEAFDGQSGWGTDPWDGRREPFRMSADESNGLREELEIEGPLVDWRAKGHKVEYLGTEDVDGTRAHKLRVTLAWGDVEYRYLDPDTFLEIRIVVHRFVRGVERISEQDLGGYARVAGVWFPFDIESGTQGQPRRSRLSFARMEANVDVDDALLRFPSAGATVARAILAGPASSAPDLRAPATPRAAGVERRVADSGVLSGIDARNIGSAAMSGRVSAIAAYADKGTTVVYVGAASGGVWRSFDGGTTFKPVFDEAATQSIGAIAIDPAHPKVVWVGTGESWTRNSVSIGDGIYKSIDAGETWANMGLPSSERIARILVSPANGDVVYACVPGKLWSDGAERGVYKTTDGGRHWAQIVKGANLSTGCASLAMDPKDPQVLFAGMWDFRRKGWTFRSGGEGPGSPSGSALLRTADGGETWTTLTPAANRGLPAGPWGRVTVEIAPSDPKIVYALIESKSSALFRSSDGGATWEERDKSQMMVWRPFYFGRLVVDPKDPERVFKPDYNLVVSDDGGRSFTASGSGGHGDWHEVWIDPGNTKHVIGGDDGGLWTSWDGGNRWWKSNNLPISQFYHVSVDDRDPYEVYGGLQDNFTWVGESSYPGGVANRQWEPLSYGDGFWVIVDPTDPSAVYAESQGGEIVRVDRRTHAVRNIKPRAGYKEKLRFNWNTPIHASPTQSGTIYVGAQYLLRSRDRGDTWERISPDLTTNDPTKQQQERSGGVTVDNSSAEMHTTIYSISESPKDARVVWAGTDDGNLQVTRDGGSSWTNVIANVKWLPKSSWVSWVEASRFDAGTAYVAFDRHTLGDMEPWVYRTTDFGATWVRIVGPWHGVSGYAHVIKEDLEKRSLLYLGTERGLWISVDGGVHWAQFKGGKFPNVAVRDLALQGRERDLVIATHGRGLWIIDDLTPLRALGADVLATEVAFLPGRPVQERLEVWNGAEEGDAAFVGQSAPGGAVITFYQRTRHMFGPLRLEVLDASGKVLDTLNAPRRRGINRVTWNMRIEPPRVPRAAQTAWGSAQGPRVLPGTYTLRLTKGGETFESKLTLGLDHRVTWTLEDRKAQLALMMRAHALFGRMSEVVAKLDGARAASEGRLKALPASDPMGTKIRGVLREIDEAKKRIVATTEGGAITGEERIREHLDQLYSAVNDWEGRPAKYQVDGIEALARELDDVTRDVDGPIARDVRALDPELRGRGLDAIPTDAREEHAEGSTAHFPDVGAAVRCAITRGDDCEEAERALAAGARGQERD